MSASVHERIYISGGDRITHYENNLVTWHPADREPVPGLEPRRLFPVSHPDDYITLLDGEGLEVAVIRHLTDLDDGSRDVIAESLRFYYLIPVITAIYSASEKYGTLHWEVETDHGRKTIDIRNRTRHIRVQADGCVRIRDADDNRYLIRDYRKLDKHSQKFLTADL